MLTQLSSSSFDVEQMHPKMVITLALTLCLGLYFIFEREQLANSQYEQQLRRDVLHEMAEVRENIQSEIFDRILEMRSLSTIISRNPNVSDTVFGKVALKYLERNPEVINIALAPDLIVRSVFPIEGNEKAVGLNYRTNIDQFPKVQQAMKSGHGLVTGPVNLVQGGRGLILRQPIFVAQDEADEGSRRDWGILSMVVDYESFLAGLGLSDLSPRYDVLIREIGVEVYEQQTFYGETAILLRDPERLIFKFPFGVWELAATTKGGWPEHRPEYLRSLISELLFLAFVLGALLYVMRLTNAYRTTKLHLTNAIEALPDGFVMFDPNGNLVMCNSKYKGFNGVDSALIQPGVSYETLVKSALESGGLLDAVGHEEEWLEEWRDKRKDRNFDADIFLTDGRIIRVSDRVMADQSTVGVRMDITELNAAKVAAEAANKAKSDFMAVLSHELRTPLTVMLGMARLLKSLRLLPSAKALTASIDSLPEEYQQELAGRSDSVFDTITDMMTKLENSGEHLMFLVNEILDYAKMEASGLTLNEKRVDIASIITTAADQISPMIAAKGLTFEVDPVSAEVIIDPKRIQQVLMNLLGNAAKFTPSGTISITAKILPRNVEIRVRDTGLGMPEGEVEKIFEPFHQVDASNKRGIGGTGLGLAISREIAVAHGGTLTATTVEGEGSEFCLTLKLPANLEDESDA